MSYPVNVHQDKTLPIPSGLPELISDISKEVLRCQPKSIIPFIANYLEAQLEVREISQTVTDYVQKTFEDIYNVDINYKQYGISKEMADEAARKIQGLYKGFKTRKDLREIIAANAHLRHSDVPKIVPKITDRLSINYLKGSGSTIADSLEYDISSLIDLNPYDNLSDTLTIRSEYYPAVTTTKHTDLPKIE